MKTKFQIAAAMLAACAVSAHAAQTGPASYPDRPIRLVLGSAAGSGPDIISRVISERLYKSWGQRVVVDARPGAAGIIAADLVNHSAPDGYTWMMLTSQLLVASLVFPDPKVNLEKDFASISLIGTVPFVMSANQQLGARSIQDVIDLAKKKPGALKYGSAGAGASEHLCGVLFSKLTGTSMLHVPYKGIAQAIADTVANEVQLTFPVLPAALPMVHAGRLRALGVTTPKRSPQLPDVPAIGEVVPGYQMMGWYSLVAPSRVSPAILDKVSAEVVKAVRESEFGEQLKALGVETVGSTRAELDAFRRDQIKRIAEIVKASGVELK